MLQCLIWKVRGAVLQEGFQAVKPKWLKRLCTRQSWITYPGPSNWNVSHTTVLLCVENKIFKGSGDSKALLKHWCPLCRSPLRESQRLDSVICSYRHKTFWWSPHVSCFRLYSLKLYRHKENCHRWRSEENQHLKEKYIHKTFWIIWHFPLKESHLTLYECQ